MNSSKKNWYVDVRALRGVDTPGGDSHVKGQGCSSYLSGVKKAVLVLLRAGAHYWGHATTPHSCHGVFTDRSIFSLNLTRIQIPAGNSVTNHEHGPNFMYLVFYYVDMCT